MNAFEFLLNMRNMCKAVGDCDNCPLCNSPCSAADYPNDEEVKEIIEAVDKWTRENNEEEK